MVMVIMSDIENFEGPSGKQAKKYLYGLVGILQLIVLLLQVFSVNQQLQDKCPAATTTVERETANWAAWLNFASLVLVGAWGMSKDSDALMPVVKYLIKLLWIGSAAIASILSAVSMGHSLTIGSKCADLDKDSVRDASVAIVVLWIILLALGHSGKKEPYAHKKDDDASNTEVPLETVEKSEVSVPLNYSNNDLRF